MELSLFGRGGGANLEMDAGKGPQKAVCLLCSLFTFLRVILAPRVEGRGEQGEPTCRWGLSVVGALAAPGHVGGT